MSNDDNQIKSKKNRKRKKNENLTREKNKLAMRIKRAQNAEFNNKREEYIPQAEKNKVAMQKRRGNDLDYRMREKIKNRVAMRLKRNSEEYRMKENQRNRIAMQRRRKRMRQLADVNVDVIVKNEKD